MKIYPKKNNLLFLLLSVWVVSLSGQHDTLVAERLLEEGIAWYEEGNYESARKPLEKALTLRQKYYPPNHIKIEDLYYWLGSNEQGIRNNEKSLEYYFAGLEIAKQRLGEESEIVGDFYMDIANTYDQMYRIAEAKKYYEKVLSIYQKKYGLESSEVGNVYMNIGIGQRKMGHYELAGEYYDLAYRNFQKSSDPSSKDFYRIYINKSVLYSDLGDYDQGLAYILKSLKIKLLHYDTLHPSVHKYYSIIGDNYQAKGMLEEALTYHQKALAIAEHSRGKDHPETAGEVGTIASIYADQGKLDQALDLHQQALKVQEKNLTPTHPYLIASYRDIAWIHQAKKNWDQALAVYHTVLSRYRTAPDVPRHFIAETLEDMATIYFAQGQIKKALLTIRDGISQITPAFDFSEEDLYQNPPLDQVQGAITFLDLLTSKSLFLQASYRKNNSREDLRQALVSSELAITLIEQIRRSYQSESAKEFLNNHTAPIFDRGVEQAFELYRLTNEVKYLRKAFELSEKSKASILWQNINGKYALATADMPAELLDSIRNIEFRIGDLEEQLLDPLSEGERSKREDEIFLWKEKYQALLTRVEQSYPKYFDLKYAPASFSPEQLQATLPDDNTALIEYYYTEKMLYIFVLTKDDLLGKQIPVDADFTKGIIELRNNDVHQIALHKNQRVAYLKLLHQYYNVLIASVLSEVEYTQRLIVIPHGILQYLSFESLAPDNGTEDFRHLDYLLKEYSLQYHWSAALWAQEKDKKSAWEYGYLGFAPSFGGSDLSEQGQSGMAVSQRNMGTLTHALPELEGAQQYFSGAIYAGGAATEAQFKAKGPQSKIIHLATHAIANDLSPMQSGLLFTPQKGEAEDGFLYAQEIYNLNLAADLAMVSACNTGFGKFSKGEGIMSLGRAFLYAGCKSVIMSLWLANDESTSRIVPLFYKYAANGISKDEALRRAKIDYLEQADPLTAHPYFWANLVAVGDMQALQQQRLGYWLWLGMGLLFATLLGWGFWKYES